MVPSPDTMAQVVSRVTEAMLGVTVRALAGASDGGWAPAGFARRGGGGAPGC